MTDEPECRGLTEDEKNFLRTWADTYHRLNPQRQVYVNQRRAQDIPVQFNRYVNHGNLAAVPRRIRDDQRCCSIIFYEICCFIDFQQDGSCIGRDDFEVPQAAGIL